jgi:DNA-binding Lrp family transcriptional regulator
MSAAPAAMNSLPANQLANAITATRRYAVRRPAVAARRSSRNACWRRVKRLEEERIITGRVALVDADRLGLGLSVFILIRTSSHEADWLRRFR